MSLIVLQTLLSCRSVDHVQNINGEVVVSRAEFHLNLNAISVLATSGSATFSIANFRMPTITSTVLSLGFIALTELDIKDLKACGLLGKSQCSSAVIRMYTTGALGPGIYSATEDCGASLSAGQNSLRTTIGLTVSSAAVLQRVTIASSKKSLKLSDFPSPIYNVDADFSNAGAGVYGTILVIEFALLP